MKTLQQWLKEIDIDELVLAFLIESPPAYWEIKANHVSASEAFRRLEEALREFVADFLKIDPVSNEEKVFFAYPTQVDISRDLDVNLIYLKELDDSYVEHYDWSMADRNELAGYLIADTEFNKSHIVEMLTTILADATFYGFSEQSFSENRAEVQQELEESMRSVENGKTYTLEEVREHLGLPPLKNDPEEERLRRATLKAKHQLDSYCRARALNEIRCLMGRSPQPIPYFS